MLWRSLLALALLPSLAFAQKKWEMVLPHVLDVSRLSCEKVLSWRINSIQKDGGVHTYMPEGEPCANFQGDGGKMEMEIAKLYGGKGFKVHEVCKEVDRELAIYLGNPLVKQVHARHGIDSYCRNIYLEPGHADQKENTMDVYYRAIRKYTYEQLGKKPEKRKDEL